MRILVIEDDKEIAELINIHLTDDQYQVDLVDDGHDGFIQAVNGDYDLIVLDLMLPGMSGMDICQSLRQNNVTTPILMLTSKSEELDKVLGLESGADDYMTKPFSIRELKARVRAILRREKISKDKPTVENQVIVRHDLRIDLSKHKVELKNQRVDLTPKEFELLRLLAANPGKTYSRANLLNQVWGNEFEGYEHTVNSHINRLRTKLEVDASNPEYILTTWGIGYRFSEEI